MRPPAVAVVAGAAAAAAAVVVGIVVVAAAVAAIAVFFFVISFFFVGVKQLSRVFMGEGAGLIYSVDAAEKITRDVAREAEEQLDSINKLRTCVGWAYFSWGVI